MHIWKVSHSLTRASGSMRTRHDGGVCYELSRWWKSRKTRDFESGGTQLPLRCILGRSPCSPRKENLAHRWVLEKDTPFGRCPYYRLLATLGDVTQNSEA
jgi:hypothetical protein